MIVCTFCDGRKGRTVYACPGFRQVHMPCTPCGGTGELTMEQSEQYALWKITGEALRKARIAARVSMLHAAAAHGISAPRYSRIEFGMEPAPWLAVDA